MEDEVTASCLLRLYFTIFQHELKKRRKLNLLPALFSLRPLILFGENHRFAPNEKVKKGKAEREKSEEKAELAAVQPLLPAGGIEEDPSHGEEGGRGGQVEAELSRRRRRRSFALERSGR